MMDASRAGSLPALNDTRSEVSYHSRATVSTTAARNYPQHLPRLRTTFTDTGTVCANFTASEDQDGPTNRDDYIDGYYSASNDLTSTSLPNATAINNYTKQSKHVHFKHTPLMLLPKYRKRGRKSSPTIDYSLTKHNMLFNQLSSEKSNSVGMDFMSYVNNLRTGSVVPNDPDKLPIVMGPDSLTRNGYNISRKSNDNRILPYHHEEDSEIPVLYGPDNSIISLSSSDLSDYDDDHNDKRFLSMVDNKGNLNNNEEYLDTFATEDNNNNDIVKLRWALLKSKFGKNNRRRKKSTSGSSGGRGEDQRARKKSSVADSNVTEESASEYECPICVKEAKKGKAGGGRRNSVVHWFDEKFGPRRDLYPALNHMGRGTAPHFCNFVKKVKLKEKELEKPEGHSHGHGHEGEQDNTDATSNSVLHGSTSHGSTKGDDASGGRANSLVSEAEPQGEEWPPGANRKRSNHCIVVPVVPEISITPDDDDSILQLVQQTLETSLEQNDDVESTAPSSPPPTTPLPWPQEPVVNQTTEDDVFTSEGQLGANGKDSSNQDKSDQDKDKSKDSTRNKDTNNTSQLTTDPPQPPIQKKPARKFLVAPPPLPTRPIEPPAPPPPPPEEEAKPPPAAAPPLPSPYPHQNVPLKKPPRAPVVKKEKKTFERKRSDKNEDEEVKQEVEMEVKAEEPEVKEEVKTPEPPPSLPKPEVKAPALPQFRGREPPRRKTPTKKAGRQGLTFLSPFDDPNTDKETLENMREQRKAFEFNLSDVAKEDLNIQKPKPAVPVTNQAESDTLDIPKYPEEDEESSRGVEWIPEIDDLSDQDIIDECSMPALQKYVQTEMNQTDKKPRVQNWLQGRLALSQQSSRFELPIDMKTLESMSGEEYLKKYCVISQRRQGLYHKVHSKYKERSGTISVEDMGKALQEVLINTITQPDIDELCKVIGLSQDSTIDYKLFSGIAAVAERMLYPKFVTDDTAEMKEYKKETIECADFSALDWKLHGLNVNPHVKTILKTL